MKTTVSHKVDWAMLLENLMDVVTVIIGFFVIFGLALAAI